MKKVIAIFLVFAICLSFTACEYGFSSVESLMRPPKLSGEDRALQDSFEATVSKYEDVVMETPISGKYRSSYILFDIDNDDKEEAIVLYSVPAEDNFVIAEIFKYSNDNWLNVSQIKGNSEEIYEVNFADVNGDGCYEIFLSWNGEPTEEKNVDTRFNSTRTLMIYSYDGVKTDLILTEPYTNLFTLDLNNNSADEILIFKINLSDIENRTTVRLISFNNNYSIYYNKVTKITGMIEINNILNDRVDYANKSISRIFVDGAVNEHEIITEIIEINEKNFNISLPLYNDNCTKQPRTLRKANINCIDVGKDGDIEIPITEVFPYAQQVSEGKKGPMNLVVWLEYSSKGLSVEYKTLLNTKFGLVIFIPEDYIGNVSVVYDEDNFNLTFYSIDSDGTFKNALFSFRIFTIPDWEENNYSYVMLYENDIYVYSYLIFKADNYEIYKKFITENIYAL